MTITVLNPVADGHVNDTAAGLSAKDELPAQIQIYDQRLADQISALSNVAQRIAAEEESQSAFLVAEIELNLVITETGKLALLGSGVEAGAEAAVKVKFTRRGNGQMA